jgi:hypothetical protein
MLDEFPASPSIGRSCENRLLPSGILNGQQRKSAVASTLPPLASIEPLGAEPEMSCKLKSEGFQLHSTAWKFVRISNFNK